VVINFIYNNGNNLWHLMMNLQDIMVKLAEYSVGCRIMDGYFLINITYDGNWNVIPPENDKIEFAQKNGVSYYMAMINEVSFEEVFNSIKETIDYNIDLQKKVNLFKSKVDELQEIFAKEDLETLRTITFEYCPKKKEKRKYVKKKDKEEKKQSLVEDDTTAKETNIAVIETKDIDSNISEVKVEEIPKQDNTEEDYDGVTYEEYQGEETIIDTVNKVDYLEQLK
jgi:hypothetical protein